MWPENVHIFTEPEIETVELPELGCTVHGAAFTAPHRTDRALEGFHAPSDGNLHLLVLHCDGTPDSRYGPITEEDLSASGIDYAALGHIHARIGPRRAGRPYGPTPAVPKAAALTSWGIRACCAAVWEREGCSWTLSPVPGAT